ncbi:MAG: DNA polymerase III subunit gamma and tau [Nocardioidaceae bacterium]
MEIPWPARTSYGGSKVGWVDAPLALYRRYRPDTFADVIGQEQVTEPLSQALANNRVNHAYLFSGPRGCGKTTSARIMARALNCEQGPTPTPCGKCESCRELARGGPGSVDVIEIDAASHGGVDDARELRERAFFTPMKARYKVYIIDEAHMVTPQGFNALLKLVEEPPPHLRFIFATTEPEKVIGTIKSRTHHYPFRLVPPKVLGEYLLDLCAREGVTIAPTVVPLVVRAGAGSVRDSLSVLDQLIGGSGPEGVTYGLATALLGYTPDSLLDETVDALAADDGATLFAVIDKVVDTGQDPRRFAEDLLHRLRDLVVVSVVPDAARRGLLEVADDQAERLTGQAARFGRAELTRAADIVSQGLTEMRGATAPRLLLEMMCAKILLPGMDQTAEGLGARIDRMERRLSMVGEPTTSTVAAPHAASSGRSVGASSSRAPDEGGRNAIVTSSSTEVSTLEAAPVAPLASDVDAGVASAGGSEGSPEVTATEPVGQVGQTTSTAGRTAGPVDPQPSVAGTATETGHREATDGSTVLASLSLVDVRQLWPGVLDRVKKMRRYAWILLSQNAHIKDLDGDVLTIGLVNAGARDSFMRSGADEIVRQALIDELGVDWRVEAIIDAAWDASPRTSRQVEPPPAVGSGPARWVAEPAEGAASSAEGTAESTGSADLEPGSRPSAATDNGFEPTDDDGVSNQPTSPGQGGSPTTGTPTTAANVAAEPTKTPTADSTLRQPASDASDDVDAGADAPPDDAPDTIAVPGPDSAGGQAAPEPAAVPPVRTAEVEAAKEAIRKTRSADRRQPAQLEQPVDDVSDDDEVIDDATLTSHELLARELGAEIIEDIHHAP